MPEQYRLVDLFMTEIVGKRKTAISKGKAVARITLSTSEVEIGPDSHAHVGTKVEVAVRGEDQSEDDAYCNILSEYVVIVELEGEEQIVEEMEDSIGQFAMEHTFARHRERIMETTMRMGIPLLRLPLSLQEVEERAVQDQERTAAHAATRN
ncbi:hypothetical protein [Curtobacterium flaccumfaciens]|uniref:hypothetical protein n=1 Tax=Curtobacterium flaccumfaciens TaxID=2035 RepID=UPI001BDF3F7F|nr:hypothetical protein [Curtobacterium flaccumfaciens]MBT1632370.1 hypothetical protein [Curtobacterium flaccumfaciens pv. oortii]MCX2844990.1 hypothetical protein [Curtobacterium flaccumfaciens pv. oortii]